MMYCITRNTQIFKREKLLSDSPRLEALRGIFPRHPHELFILCFETGLVFLDLEELFNRCSTLFSSRSHHQE